MSPISSAVPATPRVTSPSPTLSNASSRESYFTNAKPPPHGTIAGADDVSDLEFRRSRTKSRSPKIQKSTHRTARASNVESIGEATADGPTRRLPLGEATAKQEAKPNGHLDPSSAGMGSKYWRALSRSPSPLGLIPVHTEWRTFVRRTSSLTNDTADAGTDTQTRNSSKSSACVDRIRRARGILVRVGEIRCPS